ncbi:hypothetical protein B6D29_00835 [Microgenomates bacterium UTCPR1]|nr:MAG: hypothetical protein B6D29_00835 [Microgenomates bacterium UTCPR1]
MIFITCHSAYFNRIFDRITYYFKMKKLILKDNNAEKIIKETIHTLNNGGLVVFPTDTVYGLLVDARNERAINKLIRFKERPVGKAISVFVSDFKMIRDLLTVNNTQMMAIKRMLPGPFTVILDSKHLVCRLLESEKGTLGVRIPEYKLINDLVIRFGRPITATSANLSGKTVNYSLEGFLNSLSKKKTELIDLCVDAAKLPKNKPSTVVDLTLRQPKILRKGSLDFSTNQEFISVSVKDTKKVAADLLNKLRYLNEEQPLVFIIEGDLGVGKTVFVKGLAREAGINNIISPTYVIYYEYRTNNGKLIHIDLYNIEDDEEFRYLGIESFLKNNNILCFEWGEKAGHLLKTIKRKSRPIYIKMSYLGENKRKIIVSY